MGSTPAAMRRFPRLEALLRAVIPAVAVTVTTALVMASMWLASPVAKAGATVPGTDTSQLIWDTTNRVYYGNYNTPVFTTIDTQGKVSFAYCVDPSTTVPNASTYGTISIEEFCPNTVDEVRAAMWFGYGGPGFDPAMWPETWSDGTSMDAAKYYAASHLIVAYAVTHNASWTYYAAGYDFISYGATTFMGIDNFGRVKNTSSTRDQINARAGEVPDDYLCYMLDCGEWDYTQYIIAQDYYEPPVVTNGSLALAKTSTNPDITGSNDLYSLEGAQFGVYTDQDCTQLVATLVTDSSGYARLDELPAGQYWVRELTAPRGFAACDAVFEANVAVGATTELAIPNEPLVSQISRLVQKIDAELGSVTPQGSASLAGAEFEVNFYAGTHALDALPAAPTRSWVISTDDSGWALFDDAHLVSGDEMYRDANGTPVLPYGTVVLRESKAPDGYLLPEGGWELLVDTVQAATDEALLVQTGHRAATAQPLALLRGIFTPSVAHASEAASEPVVSEQVIRGGVRIYKVDAQTGDAQGDATLEGAEFSIVSLNDGPVLVDGTVYSYGEVVKVVYTNSEGVAQTGERDLPYGTYSIEETNPPGGYMRALQCAVIEEDGVIVELGDPFENDVVRGGIRVTKVDAGLGTGEAQGAATLEGAVFSITNASAQFVLVNGVSYAPGEVVATITTDATGVAQTGERELPYGTYTVAEVAAPAGYLLSAQTQTVQVLEDGVTVSTDPFANEVQRGGFGLRKFDAETFQASAQGDASLAGAEFSVVNANANAVVVNGATYQPGDVVTTIVTNEDGWAQTGNHDLPYGSYTVTEVTAPTGYHLGTTNETGVEDGGSVSLTAQVDADWSWYSYETHIYDQVVRGGIAIAKTDAQTGETPQGAAKLEGAEFSVTNASAHAVIVGGVTYQPGEVVMTLVTGEDGRAQSGNRDLPYGTYTVTETLAPAGYILGGESQTVSVTDESTLASTALPFANEVVRGGVSVQKVDAEIGAQGPQGAASYLGAVFEIENANATAVCVNGQTYQAGEVVATITTDETGFAATGAYALPYGTYIVRETQAPPGYLLNTTQWEVLVSTDGIVVKAGDAPQPDDEPAAEAQEESGGIIDTVLSLFSPSTASAAEASPGAYVPERVVRGDVCGTKVAAETGSPMPYVAFCITSTSTGESHVLVAGANGTLSTASSHVPHSRNTNANDAALRHNGTVDESLLDANSGIWFSGSSGAQAQPNDEVGALPFDTYRFVELPTSANYGFSPLSFEVSVCEDGTTVELGQIRNNAIRLETTASLAETEANGGPASSYVTVTDRVSYEGLVPGLEYLLRATLVKPESGAPVIDAAGKRVESTQTFIPELPNGSVEMTLSFDARGLDGLDAVVFERLYLDGCEIASHANLHDPKQQVHLAGNEPIPELGDPGLSQKAGVLAVAGILLVFVGAVALALGMRQYAQSRSNPNPPQGPRLR